MHRLSGTHRTFSLTALALALAAPLYAGQAQSSGSADTPLDTLNLFIGLDGSKQPQDLGINANMGARFSGNFGVPVAKKSNIGVQFGAALNLSDAAVHVLDQVEGTSSRQQTYLTFGVFQRDMGKVNWALGYDVLFEHYYDDFTLGQVRGQAGYSATTKDEVGVWFTAGAHGADGLMGTTPVRLDPISQVNGYYRRTWSTFAQTTIWAGVSGRHDEVVWVFPANPFHDHVFVYGADLHMPLNDRFAVTGAANFLTPTATGTVDAYLGVVFYPGHLAMHRPVHDFSPAMTVANNPTFSVNLKR
jgi:hypothetical protein